MADIERVHALVGEIEDTSNPDRIAVLVEKLKKARTWEHPRVTEKLREFRSRGLMDARGNLVGINSLGRIGPEPGKRHYFAEQE